MSNIFSSTGIPDKATLTSLTPTGITAFSISSGNNFPSIHSAKKPLLSVKDGFHFLLYQIKLQIYKDRQLTYYLPFHLTPYSFVNVFLISLGIFVIFKEFFP